VNLYCVDDGILKELKDSSSRMIAQLGDIRNTFFMSSFDIGGSDYPNPGQPNLLTDNDVDLLGGSNITAGYFNNNNNNSNMAFNDWGHQVT